MERFGSLLIDASLFMRRRFDAHARSIGVTRAQWQALFAISRHRGMSQAGLAERLEVENITLCRMVDRLQEMGLVERRADPSDRRVWRLYLTARADSLIGELHRVADRVRADSLEGIGDEDRAALTDLLSRVRANLTGRSPTEADTAALARSSKLIPVAIHRSPDTTTPLTAMPMGKS